MKEINSLAEFDAAINESLANLYFLANIVLVSNDNDLIDIINGK